MQSSDKNPVLLKHILTAALVLAIIFTVGCNIKHTAKNDPVFYTFPGTDGAANSYIVADAGKAAVIDPAAPDKIIASLKENKLQPEYIILTHGHFDHILGIDAITRQYPGIKVFVHPDDLDKLADPVKNLSTLFGARVAVKAAALPLNEGTSLKLGRVSIEVIATPGHTAGSISLKLGSTLFSGDTLLKGSVGRTDFPGSDPDVMRDSLKKLLSLPDGIKVLPGHGEPTTLGEEKMNNPYK